MKITVFLILFLSFSVVSYAEKNIRVNFKNQKIEVLPIKSYKGKASLTLDNSSFKNFTLRLYKNDKPLRYIKLGMDSSKTIDLNLDSNDKLYLLPYNPSMKILNLVSSD